MSDLVVEAEGLGKLYRLGEAQYLGDLRETLASGARRLTRRGGGGGDSTRDLWAIRDVSFEVREGEVVAIVGRNGAGKSTLLKILSRITYPTEGRGRIRGRVASLLEVGTGFHPELTGRENVYLNGSILGMGRQEIAGKFDEIVEFSGIGRFLDTPVKRYSSGMYVRLAFAVAAHLEPEVLIVDEVLAVGDFEFQQKCLGKMRDVASSGRTVIFVSHNMQAVSTLTQRAILLERGRIASSGATQDVIADYLRGGAPDGAVYTAPPGVGGPRVEEVEVLTSERNNVQSNGEAMEVRVVFSTPRPLKSAAVSVQVCDALQRPIVHLWTFDSERQMARTPGTYELRCVIPKLRLYMGRYTLTVHFSGGREKLEELEGICPFEVVMYGRQREYDWQPGTCTYLEDCDWEVSRPAEQRTAVNLP